MAYPIVASPYGLLPINLIGGQHFGGSTRMYPVPFAYGTNIFYGDFVTISRGQIARVGVTTGTTLNQTIGIFLGCSYTNPATKQKLFSQYWFGGTLAGDCVAYVYDDPDAIFKTVAVSSGTTVASAAYGMIGTNQSLVDNPTGVLTTGNSLNGLLTPTNAGATSTTTLPVRIVGIVPDTVVNLGTATYSSITSATLTVSALPYALPVGTDVSVLTTNGQMAPTGSWVIVAAAAGATSVVLNQAPTITINSGNYSATVVFNQYPEVLVKMNQGLHGYYSATGGS